MAKRNPAWARDELILALDLYFRLDRKVEDDTHPDVIETSKVLNRLPIHTNRLDAERFRNPNGVAMKLANFRAHDPSQLGKGLSRGNRMEQEVWDQFASDTARLRKTAQAIIDGANSEEAQEALPDEEDEFLEGKVLTRVHKARERSPRVVKRKKQAALRETGRLECEACGFDFEATYGSVGEGFAECHHTRPISELSSAATTTIADLAILCANCHRMIHRTKPMLPVAEFRTKVLGRKG